MITLPVVHLNGSGRASLQKQYENAYCTVSAALLAVAAIETHDRDYYPLGPDAGPAARAERAARCAKLVTIAEELLEIYNSLEG